MLTVKKTTTCYHISDKQRETFDSTYMNTLLQRIEFDHIAIVFLNGHTPVITMPYQGQMPKTVWDEIKRVAENQSTVLVVDCLNATYQIGMVHQKFDKHYNPDGLEMLLGGQIDY